MISLFEIFDDNRLSEKESVNEKCIIKARVGNEIYNKGFLKYRILVLVREYLSSKKYLFKKVQGKF